jgi:predicted dehydrogenase
MVVVREALKAQSLGKIIAVNGLWTFHKPADYFEAPTEWRKGKTGGAVLINLIHEIDLLQYLLGPLIRVHAEATISTRGHEAEERAALTMKFESGAVGTFIVSDSVPSPYNLESGTGENPFIPKTGVVFYTILGTNASLSVPDMTRYSHDGVDEKTWHAPLTKDNLFVPEGILLDYN